MDYTQAKRQARQRQRLEKQGGKRMSFDITPEHHAKLKNMIQQGVASTIMDATRQCIEVCDLMVSFSNQMDEDSPSCTKRIGVELYSTHVEKMRAIQDILGCESYSPSRAVRRMIDAASIH